ncbi:MAG: type II toxin-antitoxin system RelE/ParE family toxin [Candidatus Saccharimonas sp.]|nr:type II toxin-antitoxin system RelE/ParE family toxin [Planctomycetaceae bacterium]
MTTRTSLTPRAEADIDAQVAWLAKQSTRVAFEFFDAVQFTIQSVVQSPESGSVWEFEETVAPSPRVSFFKVRGFPNHLVFYTTSPDRIRILRLLHAARDITPLALADDSPG